MIPLKLQLKNFLSYGDCWTTVDFAPHHFICLSGKNGHGKSALLDAVTWALWGQARKTAGVARSDEALVHLGQRHMVVVIEFMCHDQRYIVKRELILYQDKTKLTLDFGVFDGEKLRSLTEKTLRMTQEQIQKIIGLDFESFSNSVFLRQGQSNEFSKKTAQERKQILTTILGLDQYEQLRKSSLEKLRACETQKVATVQLHQYAQLECTRMADVPQQLAECRCACVQIEQQEQQLIMRKQEAQEQKKQLITCQQEFLQVQAEFETAQRDLQTYTHEQQLKSLQDNQAQEIMCVSYESDLRVLSEKKEFVAARITQLSCELAEIEQQRVACTQLVEAAQKVEPLYICARALFEKRKELYQRMVAHGNWVHNEQTSIKQQQEQVSVKNNSFCPLCRQQLSGSYQQLVCEQLGRRTHFYAARMARVEKFIKNSKQKLAQEHACIKNYEQELQQSESAHVRSTELEIRAKQIIGELDLVRAECFVLDAQHQKTIVSQQELRQQLTSAKSLIVQKLEQDAHYKKLQQKIMQLAGVKQKLQDVYSSQAVVLEREERACESDMQELLAKKSVLLQQHGKLTQECAQLELSQRAHAQHAGVIKKLECECIDYEIIAQALGKDGIQALLIESVIPELEEEANEVLSRLSDQQTRVFIESVRDLKSGGIRETLDIKIADSAGIRPYELFSGGETFRIDFALRIAISKLLARRAGASLQTLIVDEGFGSQDEEGLALIIDMLYKIQDYFAKVIIVSHLPFLKDQVPVQFLVEKRAHGSMITVIEQN